MNTPEGRSEEIASGIAEGARRAKIGFGDRRMLSLYCVVVVFFILSSLWQQHFTHNLKAAQRAAYVNCLQINAGNARLNGLLDQQIANVKKTTGLTPEAKAQALVFYQKAHLNLADCERQRP